MRVAVAGGGIAGLACALGLARAGHEIVVVERDPAGALDDPRGAFSWERAGVPQFQQPHVLVSLACRELRVHAPDVYACLLEAGATEILGSHPDAVADPDLRALCVRRPVLEWALRRALADEESVTVRHGDTVRNLAYDDGSAPGVNVWGLITDAGLVTGDVVVDALGRTSPMPGLLADLARAYGAVPGEVLVPRFTGRAAYEVARGIPCGMAYYSRYYRLRPANPARPGHHFVAAAADFGYASGVLFWAEKEAGEQLVGLVISVPAGDQELKALRDEDFYDRVVAATPALARVIGPGLADPVTPVRPMGGLRASWRRPVTDDGRLTARNVFTVGDALCHTNPAYGWGASLALSQAFTLPAVLAGHDGDVVAAQGAYARRTGPLVEDRFGSGVALDRGIERIWAGEEVDVLAYTMEPDLFRMRGLSAAAQAAPLAHQRQGRWAGCLDPAAAIDADEPFRTDAAAAARVVRGRPRPESERPPARDDLLALVPS
ncbi:FAD-dependent monooxygenase [Hamadaea tsunoensis]|uniref:FAD-dependent monooxygenase n=1 Tax=Hamadaea tsunoensis TaxID=53368 RepID=UPI000406E0AB|nr:FAD-dependent oxidoreductase [Hamadaea tsunoensis]